MISWGSTCVEQSVQLSLLSLMSMRICNETPTCWIWSVRTDVREMPAGEWHLVGNSRKGQNSRPRCQDYPTIPLDLPDLRPILLQRCLLNLQPFMYNRYDTILQQKGSENYVHVSTLNVNAPLSGVACIMKISVIYFISCIQKILWIFSCDTVYTRRLFCTVLGSICNSEWNCGMFYLKRQ